MHPLFFVFFLASAGWFFYIATISGRSVGARLGLALLGVVEFVFVMVVIGQIVRQLDSFRRALMHQPDMQVILTYEVLPTLVIVFLTGLLLKKNAPSMEDTSGTAEEVKPPKTYRCTTCAKELSESKATVFLGKCYCEEHYKEALG